LEKILQSVLQYFFRQVLLITLTVLQQRAKDDSIYIQLGCWLGITVMHLITSTKLLYGRPS